MITISGKVMAQSPSDSAVLSAINAQFIQNFLKQDAKAHSEIIHNNFVIKVRFHSMS